MRMKRAQASEHPVHTIRKSDMDAWLVFVCECRDGKEGCKEHEYQESLEERII